MKLTISQLRKIIREEVARNNADYAGVFCGGGISRSNKGIVNPPPGLGSTEEDREKAEDESHEKASEKCQLAARVLSRRGPDGSP